MADKIHSAHEELLRQKDYIVKELNSAVADRGIKGDRPVVSSKPDQRIPVRLTRGPLDFGLPANRLKGNDSLYYSSPEFTLGGDERFELVNFIDGRSTVSEIRNALSAEFAPVETKVVAHYLEDLIKVGVVKWK